VNYDDVKLLLRRWGDWAQTGRMNLGYPKETLSYRMIKFGGQMIRGSGQKVEEEVAGMEEIEKIITHMPMDLKSVIVKKYQFNSEDETTARELAISVPTVRNRYLQAYAWIGAKLESNLK